MEKQSPGERSASATTTTTTITTTTTTATATPSTSAAVTMATASSSNTTCTQAPSTSLSIIPSDRQAVQLILTPAAPVAAVQSDLPAVTSCSSLPTSSQVQNLALHAHLPGALATAHSVILKPSAQSQALSPAASLSKMSLCALKTNQLTDSSTETGQPGAQIIAPAYSPVQAHALVKQQLSCPSGQRVAHHQLILQQATAGALNHRQLQPIALRVAPQEPSSTPLSLSAKRLTTPSNQPPPPPPPLVLPRLPQNPPASLQRLSVHSVQALAIQSGQVLLTEHELPVAEALVQMPYQNLPPPQTVAVDLKVHSVRRSETSLSGQTCKVNGLSPEGSKDERSPSRQRDKTPTPLIVSPKQNGAVIRPPQVEEPSQLTTTTTTTTSTSSTTTTTSSSSNCPPPPPPLPSPILPAAVRGPSQPPSAPASVPGSPDRILTTHVLTHLIEGFVIREGLEPFPVGPSSLLAEQQASLPESQEIHTNGDAAAEDSPLDADQSDTTDSEMENDAPTADGEVLAGESDAGVLQCEYCGSRGYAQTFLRSKRFCSMTCVRRFSVSCTKRITMLRAGRWLGHRPMGRRGRPPSRVNGASREHFLRRVS
ncbi:hypothetical protein INR49_013213 [Caranx melampygus]|nr:hypothetical protein INR49_013213 [Caranx melampygus]